MSIPRPTLNFLAFIGGVVLVAIVAALMNACAALQPAKTFEAQLAYAYGVHTAIQNAALQAGLAGTLSKADGASVLKTADQAKTFLLAAEAANGVGDIKTAAAQLQLATNILTELRDYLNARVTAVPGAKP